MHKQAPLFYTDIGSGDIVVLLHGMVGSHRYWDGIIPELAKNHRVIAFDLLGFGKSPKPDDIPYSLKNHVDALMLEVKALKLNSFTLVGHSMGSIIALGIADAFPQIVTKLVLTSMPIYETPEIAKKQIIHSKLAPKIMLYGPTARIVCQLVCYAHPIMRRLAPYLLPKLPRAVAIDSLEHNWVSYSRSLRHVIQEQQVITQLGKVSMPTKILMGTKDQLLKGYSPKDLRALSNHIEVELLNTTHHLPLEAPDAVIQAIVIGSASR